MCACVMMDSEGGSYMISVFLLLALPLCLYVCPRPCVVYVLTLVLQQHILYCERVFVVYVYRLVQIHIFQEQTERIYITHTAAGGLCNDSEIRVCVKSRVSGENKTRQATKILTSLQRHHGEKF